MKIVKAAPKGWGDPWEDMGYSKDWSNGPLMGLDLETTSALPQFARIVTSAIVLDDPTTNTVQEWTWISNPECLIELDAIAVHGISQDYVESKGRNAEDVIREMFSIISALQRKYNCPLVTVNSPFDLTILNQESMRLGIGALDEKNLPPILDTLCIDRRLDPWRRGRRTLTATMAAYSMTVNGAHIALNDIKASIRLVRKMAEVYPAFATADLRKLQILQKLAHKEWCDEYENYKRLDNTGFTIASKGWPIQRYDQ